MTTTAQSIPTTSPALSQKRIIKYWLPLAASWLLMASEMPFINAALARLNDVERMIAAFGIVAVIAITIESPVISLLATSTALARTRQNYLTIRRFTIHLIILTTVVHLLMGWTPLYDLVVIRWMGVPESLHQPVRLGLQIMVLWSAAIAWRRFTQGMLIRFGLTRYVGMGTVVRLLSSAGTALGLAVFTDLQGIVIGTVAMEVGVIAEASYAHWVARDLIDEKFGEKVNQSDHPDLSYGELLSFHWPLAASNLLFLLTRPMISAALARSATPITNLAAWPILSGLLFLTRAPTVALPEVVIALYDEQGETTPLLNFSIKVGLMCSLILTLFSFTPLSRLYFQALIGVSDELAQIALVGARVALALPLITAGLSYYRGALTASRTTFPITIGMAFELLTMAGVLVLGVVLKAPGILVASIAMTLSMVADGLVLLVTVKYSQRKKTA